MVYNSTRVCILSYFEKEGPSRIALWGLGSCSRQEPPLRGCGCRSRIFNCSTGLIFDQHLLTHLISSYTCPVLLRAVYTYNITHAHDELIALLTPPPVYTVNQHI